VEDKDYCYLTSLEFEEKIEKGEFLEWARVHDFYYGTLKQEVERKSKAGLDVILEIDPQGAFQVKEKLRDAVLIFIKPPSLEILEKRLRGRGTESEEVIERRLKNAQEELKQEPNYKYVIINADIDKASEELAHIIERER
jgi:guanylate kinase